MKNENLPYRRKGSKVYNKFYFDPTYVFNEIRTEDGDIITPYSDDLEEQLSEGKVIEIKTIDGEYCKGIIQRDYKIKDVFVEILIDEFKTKRGTTNEW